MKLPLLGLLVLQCNIEKPYRHAFVLFLNFG